MIADAPKNRARAPLHPLNAPTLALSTLGMGFLRPAPGTWGSMPPPALAAALLLTGVSPGIYHAAMFALLAITCVCCVRWGGYAEQRFGRKDAAEVVIDETAGQTLTLLAVPYALLDPPASLGEASWIQVIAIGGWCALAFVLFRIFDIIKPPPGRSLERLPRGWGVLADDLAAGVYALGVLQLIALAAS